MQCLSFAGVDNRYYLEIASSSKERSQVIYCRCILHLHCTNTHVAAGVVRYIGRLETDAQGQLYIGVHLIMPGVCPVL